MPKNLNIFHNLRRLKHIKRCNNFPTVISEDVAQHSYFVALSCMIIADEYNESVAKHNMGYHPFDVEHQLTPVNVEFLLRKALSHDTDEAFTSDIPWSIKHASEEVSKVLNEVIQTKMDKIYDGSGAIDGVNYYCKSCKSNFEGQFVDILDMLELAYYCFEEVTSGNCAMKSLMSKALSLVKSHTLYDTLYSHSSLFKSIIDMLFSDEKAAYTEKLINLF